MSMNFILVGSPNEAVAFVDSYGFKVCPAVGDPYVFAVHGATGDTVVKGLLSVDGDTQLGGALAVTGQLTVTANILGLGNIQSTSGYLDASANQVVGQQQPAIANADATVESLTAQLNALLSALRIHGLIAG